MRNPLRKRIPRELIKEFGKYAVIFIFLTATIGFVSGFLVAAGSMTKAYEESYETYNVEDGHFELLSQITKEEITRIEKEKVTLYENFFLELDTDSNGKKDTSTLRVYQNRDEINQVCVMEGRLPKKENEIAIDRMYAENNKIKVNDVIRLEGKEVIVTGYVALSDYSALFSNNSDMMFDAVKFGVGVMSKEGFLQFKEAPHYNYSWKYKNTPTTEKEKKEASEDFLASLVKVGQIKNYVPEYDNQAIHFAGEDLGKDKSIMLVLLYILIAILAFVFMVTIHHTIVKEAGVIGTLRASGYKKSELFLHYMASPMLVTLCAAIVGNVLGYTVFKNIAASLYYGSYSLPTYHTVWNLEAFLLTTVVPLVIMLGVNMISLLHSLKLSPLQFLRRDFKKNKGKKQVKLPNVGFMNRFRMRIMIQNCSSYFTLLGGIVFSSVLLMFGLMMSPLLSHFQASVLDFKLAKYQYILKTPTSIENQGAEEYSALGLTFVADKGKEEEITVYGIKEKSAYVKESMPKNGVLISDGFAEKYKLKEGDTFTLKEKYENKRYKFKVQGIKEYPAAMAIFMSNKAFIDVFEKDEGYFNGYFSNKELDLPQEAVVSVITEEDMTKITRQLDLSMGDMFVMINVFAVVLFSLLIYLLTKLILERNTNSISLVKIIGYDNLEIGKLYLVATTWVVIASILVSLFLSTFVMKWIYAFMMKEFNGWLTFYIKPTIYIEMFVISIMAYAAVALMQLRKIKRIPMQEVLKNVE